MRRLIAKRSVFGLFLLLLFAAITPLLDVTAQDDSRTWIVDAHGSGDFDTIQAAVNMAQTGDTVFVKSGHYSERIVIGKSLTLLGEDMNKTIVDGSHNGTIVTINAHNVQVRNFTLQNSGWELMQGAVYVSGSSFNVSVSNNTMINNEYGVLADPGSYVIISDNLIIGNGTTYVDPFDTAGIMLFSNYCTAKGNLVLNVKFGIMVNGNFNLIHNNTVIGEYYFDGQNFTGSFFGIGSLVNKRLALYTQQSTYNNTVTCNTLKGSDFQLDLLKIANWTLLQNNIIGGSGFGYNTPYYNQWDNGYPAGGNYWSSGGVDFFSGPYQNITGPDGICDQPKTIYSNNTDHYPFYRPITNFTISPALPVPPTSPLSPTPTPTLSPAPAATISPSPTSQPAVTPSSTSSPSLTQTKLQISCQCSTNYSDFKVELNGKLTSNLSNISSTPVMLTYSIDDGIHWGNLTVAITDEEGYFSAMWSPSMQGCYRIKADWIGNATFSASSVTIYVAVTPFMKNSVFSVVSNSSLSKVNVNSGNTELTFSVFSETGKTGLVHMYLAKGLVDDSSIPAVFLDGNPLICAYDDVDDYWFISFTYPNGTHGISVKFSSSTPLPFELMVTLLISSILIALLSIKLLATLSRKR